MGCFIYDDKPKEKEAEETATNSVNPKAYELARQRAAFREVENKEGFEAAAILANLDSYNDAYHLNMNTELVEEAIADWAIVEAMVSKPNHPNIFSPWIGQLLTTMKTMNVSIDRRGRKEKENIAIGAKKQRGIPGMAYATQQHPQTNEGGTQQQ